MEPRRYCTFYLADLLFGLPVERVQEVIRAQPMTAVPLAPTAIRGLMNLRGQIITVLELRRRLELPDRDPDREPTNVVVQAEEGAISLLVDRISDVLEVGDEAFEPPPQNLHGEARELIRGAYKLEGRLLLVLDIEKTLEIGRRRAGSRAA